MRSGEQFWTVLGPADGPCPRAGRQVMARCVCGTVRAITLCSFKRGYTRSCGCKRGKAIAASNARRRADHTGERFGMQIVLGADQHNVNRLRVRCDCGNERSVPTEYLTQRGVRSCYACRNTTRKSCRTVESCRDAAE
jgi:hypothetical protein